MPILTILFLAISIQHDASPFGPLSHLRVGSSKLGSASYLFQGMPDAVMIGDFAYDDRKNLAHETYLENLLERPKPYQLVLRDNMAFLASRIYVDQHQNPYLLIGSKDAQTYLSSLRWEDERSFSAEDKLLSKAMQTYLRLRHDRKDAIADWSESKKSPGRVFANVNDLAKKMSITTRIGPTWGYPEIWR